MKLGLSAAAAADGEGGTIDYRLARQATLRAWRDGQLSEAQVCDAQRELRRNAEFCGKPSGDTCPVCDEHELVEVTYVFGPRLPRHGRCVTTKAEMERIKNRRGTFAGYIVEVCVRCAWNHLVRSETYGQG